MWYNRGIMKINSFISRLLDGEQVFLRGFLPFDECKIINRPLLDRSVNFTPVTAVIFAVPYWSGEHRGRNVSLYALPKDYHLWFRGLFDRLTAALKAEYPSFSFAGFADHSPIAEVSAAASCGVGVVGDLGQLITKRYGSHVFIGEILTDMPADYTVTEAAHCPSCGACLSSCPYRGEDCFSFRNQAKGELDAKTEELIRKTGIVWGCDICRTCCPLNRNIEETPIDFFRDVDTEPLTSERVEAMTDGEFSSRAYSFRGRKTILRNLLVLEGGEKSK